MPNPQEVAVVIVQGRRFDYWESVWVQIRWTEPYPHFRFTTADIIEVPPADWQLLQFKPGDEAAIYLGGFLGIAGVIVTRQTAYEKENKGVELYGIGVTWYASRASVIHPTGNFDGKTFEQVAREVVAPTGVGLIAIGTLNATPYERLQVEPGETIWNFLERIARPRGIVLGSDNSGNLLMIDSHSAPTVATLQEGVNILKCQAIISLEAVFTDYIIRGQTAGSDDMNMAMASEQEASAAGTAKRYSPLLTPAEQPVWGQGELQDRANAERVWHEGTIVRAVITVQGWINPTTGLLWQAGQNVYVKSPMAMLDQLMKIETVTFTQDRSSGTLTTLDVVVPWLLKDVSMFNLNRPGAPQLPSDQATPAPPATSPQQPPAATLPEE